MDDTITNSDETQSLLHPKVHRGPQSGSSATQNSPVRPLLGCNKHRDTDIYLSPLFYSYFIFSLFYLFLTFKKEKVLLYAVYNDIKAFLISYLNKLYFLSALSTLF